MVSFNANVSVSAPPPLNEKSARRLCVCDASHEATIPVPELRLSLKIRENSIQFINQGIAGARNFLCLVARKSILKSLNGIANVPLQRKNTLAILAASSR